MPTTSYPTTAAEMMDAFHRRAERGASLIAQGYRYEWNPFCLDRSDEGEYSTVGTHYLCVKPTGDVYEVTFDCGNHKCSCPDFHRNGGMLLCKHLVCLCDPQVKASTDLRIRQELAEIDARADAQVAFYDANGYDGYAS